MWIYVEWWDIIYKGRFVVKYIVKIWVKYFDVGWLFCVYIYKGRDYEK